MCNQQRLDWCLKRAAKKLELENKINATKEEQKLVVEQTKALQAEKEKADKEQAEVSKQPAQQFRSNAARTRHSQELAKAALLKEKQAEAAEAAKKLMEAQAKVREKQMDEEKLEKEKREAEKALAAVANKKLKRNDTSRLDDSLTPLQKAAKDPAWSPPVYVPRKKCGKPGSKWERDSCRKLELLASFQSQMKQDGLLSKTLTFATVAELLDLHDTNSTFDERVFMHLLCLLLNQTRFVYRPG